MWSLDSVRPWQPVLEPLGAYLWLGVLLTRDRAYRTSWNIGPDEESVPMVENVLDAIVAWCKHFYADTSRDRYDFTARQIEEYTESARQEAIGWVSEAV